MPRVSKTPIYDEFSRLPNCWDFSKRPSDLKEIFPVSKKLMIELGAGTCYFSRGFAVNNPDWNILATDLKRDRLWKGAKQAVKQKLSNIAFLNIDVFELSTLIPDKSVDELWLTFPDPYSKPRQQKHRMNQPRFVSLYKSLLKTNGSFNLKTDDTSFFVETIKVLHKHSWKIDVLTSDLHIDIDDSDALIKTRYETEFIEAGLPINYLRASM